MHSNQMRLPPSQMKPNPEFIRMISSVNQAYITGLIPLLKSFIPTVTQHDPALNALMQLLYQTLEIDPGQRIKLSDFLHALDAISVPESLLPVLSQPRNSARKRTQPEGLLAPSSPEKKAKSSQVTLFKECIPQAEISTRVPNPAPTKGALRTESTGAKALSPFQSKSRATESLC